MFGFFQTIFYFGYMALFSTALGLMCGKNIFNLHNFLVENMIFKLIIRKLLFGNHSMCTS